MMVWTCAPLWLSLITLAGACAEPQDPMDRHGVLYSPPVKQQPVKEPRRFLFEKKKTPPRNEPQLRLDSETPIDSVKVSDVHTVAIPTHKFTGPYKDRAIQILRKPLFHRTGPEEIITCEPTLYEWLLDHPVQVAEFWRNAGIDVGTIESIKDGYFCKDGDNGSCRFHTVYSSAEMRVAYCVGETKTSLVPFALRAEMVLVQRYRFERYPDGKYRLVQKLDGFVTADGKTLTIAMKLAKNKSQELIDTSMANVQVFFSVASRAVQSYPTWAIGIVESNLSKWPKAESEELLKHLRALPVPPRGVTSRPVITIVPENITNQLPSASSKNSSERSMFR